MLSFMRKHAKSWLIKPALMAIVVVFVFWGIQSYREKKVMTVAYVDGNPITLQEYHETYRNMVELYRDKFKDAFSEDLLKALNLEQQALNSLIRDRLMTWGAHRLGIEVGEDELREKIASYEAFQRGGKFDQRLYLRVLEYSRTTPVDFEETERRLILTSKVTNFIKDFAKVSDEEVFDTYRYQNQKVNLSFVAFKPSMYVDETEISDEEMTQYYDKYKENYRVPSQVKVGYISLPFKDFEKEVEQAEEEKAERAEELAFQKMEEIYGHLITEHDLKKTAENSNLSFLETEFFGQDQPPEIFASDKRFVNTMFALKIGEISHILKLPNGYCVVQILDKKESYIADLASVAQKVREDLVYRKSEEIASDHANEFFQGIGEGKDLSDLAQIYGLDVEETGYFKRSESIPKMGNIPEIKEAAFSLTHENPYPEKVYRSSDGYVIFQLKSKEDVTEETFSSEKEKFKERLLFQRTQRLLEEWLAYLREEANVKINKEIPGI
jgi:peptidyl-prolyl cis-trans isomerase D